MLAFTPAVERVSVWFQWTYEPISTGWAPPVMRLVRLPEPGSIGEQDAWLMDALSAMASEMNAILREQWESQQQTSNAPKRR